MDSIDLVIWLVDYWSAFDLSVGFSKRGADRLHGWIPCGTDVVERYALCTGSCRTTEFNRDSSDLVLQCGGDVILDLYD
ncbi:hypothetical protein D3C85_1685130 [compost metagenome]